MNTTTPGPALFAAISLLSPIAAQTWTTVTATLTAPAPLVVQATSGAQTTQSTVPAGVLPAGGVLATSPSPGVYATVSWTSTAAAVDINSFVASNVGGPLATGTAGPNEFVVQFVASAPAPATLELSRTTTLTNGVPWTNVEVDLNNDGSVDFSDLAVSSSVPAPLLGVQPFAVRVKLTNLLPGNGASSTRVVLEMKPANNLSILQTAVGCAPLLPSAGQLLQVTPGFTDTGISLQSAGSANPRVFVAGFSAQPVLLPSAPIPCLLVPSPDVLLPVPVPNTATWLISLPAAVRPLAFHVQVVALGATGLLTSAAFFIDAP